MTKEVDEKRNANSIRLFGMILPSLPSILFRSGGAFLRFKREAKKGGRIFQKELIKQGLDKATASELTDIYLDGSNLFRYIRYFR
jgi:hypothetical protein